MPNYIYTDAERAKWVLDYAGGLSARAVCAKFVRENPDRPTPHHSGIIRTYNRFYDTGSVAKADRKARMQRGLCRRSNE